MHRQPNKRAKMLKGLRSAFMEMRKEDHLTGSHCFQPVMNVDVVQPDVSDP